MVFHEKALADGTYTADENNERNSERGTYVRSGGAVTVGASSTDIALNVDNVEIRVDLTDYSAAGGSVTLAANSSAYPRRDLVIARKGPTGSDPASFDVLTGTPIDQETFDTLVAEGIIEGSGSTTPGYPIHRPESIPEVQPPAAQGFRQEATVLAMVYVPPGAADSTDLSGDLITDLRMEGIGVDDVLRPGDAVTEIEDYDTATNGPLETSVTNAESLGGISATNRDRAHVAPTWTGTLAAGLTGARRVFFVPSTDEFVLDAWGCATDDGGGGTNIEIQLGRLGTDGTYSNVTGATAGPGRSEPGLVVTPGGSTGQFFAFRLANNGSTNDLLIHGTATGRILPAGTTE